jgi:hypothetical protein
VDIEYGGKLSGRVGAAASPAVHQGEYGSSGRRISVARVAADVLGESTLARFSRTAIRSNVDGSLAIDWYLNTRLPGGAPSRAARGSSSRTRAARRRHRVGSDRDAERGRLARGVRREGLENFNPRWFREPPACATMLQVGFKHFRGRLLQSWFSGVDAQREFRRPSRLSAVRQVDRARAARSTCSARSIRPPLR